MRAIVCLVLGLACTSCASALVSLAIGYERGRANLVVGESSAGVVFLERKPEHPRDVVVMLHGFGGNKDHWTRFAAQMPEELWIIAPDLPGFGESPKVDSESYDLTSQAERLHKFIEERGVQRFHLFGQSMGGQLAAVYALAHPERLESLVLFDPAGIPSPQPSEMDKLTAAGQHPLIIHTVEDFDRLVKLSFVTPPEIPDFLRSWFAEQAAGGGAFAEKVRADLFAKPRPLVDAAAHLGPPTLVVWGGSDQILDPSVIPLWRARVPSGLVVVMSKTGHGPMLERPEESAQLVLTWWTRAGLLPVTALAAP